MPITVEPVEEPTGLENQPTMPAGGAASQVLGRQAATTGAVFGEATTESIPAAAAMGASFIPGVGQLGILARMGVMATAGAGGDFIRRGVNKILGIDVEKDKKSPLATAAEAGGEQAVLEATGAAIAAPLRLAARGATKLIAPLRNAAQDSLNRAVRQTSKDFGLDLTAPEIANSNVGKMLQGIIEKRVAGGEISQVRRINLYAKAAGAVNKSLDEIGPSKSHLGMGQMVRDVRSIAEKNWRTTEATMYDEVRALAGDVRVPLKDTRAVVDSLLKPQGEAAKELPSLLGADRRVRQGVKDLLTKSPLETLDYFDKLSPEAQAALKSELPKQLEDVSVDDALRIRSALLAKIRALDKYKDRTAISQFNKVVDSVQNSIEGSLMGDAIDAWKAARDWTRTGHEVFQRGLVAKGMIRNPEAFVDAIKLTSPQDLQMAKQIIVDYGKSPSTWDAFSRGVITNKIVGGPSKDGYIDLTGISGRLRAADPDALKILTSSPKSALALKNLSRVADAMERVKTATPGMLGSFEAASDMNRMIGMAMALGTGSVAGITAKAATTFVPATFAKVLYSPKATDVMLDGLKLFGKAVKFPELSGKAVSNIIRSAQIAANVFTEMERKQNRDMEKLRSIGEGSGGIAVSPVE